MCNGLSPSVAAIAGSAVLTIVVSSVCIRNPMATSQSSGLRTVGSVMR